MSKFASYQADPFSTPGVGGGATTVIVATALAVWVGLFQLATAVFLSTVPGVTVGLIVTRKLITTIAPGAIGP